METHGALYNNSGVEFQLHMDKLAARFYGDESSRIAVLTSLVELLVDKKLDKEVLSGYLDCNAEFTSAVLSLISIDSSLESLILIIPFTCFLTEYNKKIVMFNWDNVFKVFKCLLEKLDSCSCPQENSLLFNFWTKLVSCLYVYFPFEFLKDVRVVLEVLITLDNVTKTNHITRAFAMAGLHPKLLICESLNQSSVNTATSVVLDFCEDLGGLFRFSECNCSDSQAPDVDSTITKGHLPRSTPRNSLEKNMDLVKQSFYFLYAQKTCDFTRRLNHIQSQKQFLELKLVESKKLLESQKLENAKLLEVVRDLNVKLNSTKLKNDEIYDNLVSSEEYSEQLELQLKKVTEDLTSEKKRFSDISNENCAVKAKLFECSELKNKLARKVDTSVASELMLHKLSNEVFMMNELHLRYEEKLNHFSSMGANSDLLSYGSNSNNAGVVALKRRLETEQKKNKELQRFIDEGSKKNGELEKEVLCVKTEFQTECDTIKTVVAKYELDLKDLSEKLSKAGNRNKLLNSEIQLLKAKRKSDQREKCVGTQ